MQIVYTKRNGESWDISALVDTAAWSGDYKQAARTLRVTLAFRQGTDYPQALIEGMDNGEVLRLIDGGEALFSGYIFVITGKLGETSRELMAYDGAVYLTKSAVSHNFIGASAQTITRTVATGLGVQVGHMPSDGGLAISFTHIGGTAYAAIIGAWTKVSKVSGAKYFLRMDGWQLTVRWMGDKVAAFLIDPSLNLVSGEASRSIEEAVTRAIVNNAEGAILGVAANDTNVTNYGVLQAVEANEEGVDPQGQAQGMLKDEDNQITLPDIIGGPGSNDLVTGHAVGVRVAGLGLTGRFFIINDEHTWQGGVHKVSLGLSYDALMDEEELQDLQDAQEAAATGAATSRPGTAPADGNPWATAEEIGKR